LNRIDLANRVAIITGGASGLGLGVARRFLESGATVVLWDTQGVALDAARRELSALGEVSAAVVDVVDYAAVECAAQAAGPVDILVNSAGINRPPAPLAGYPIKDWNEVIAVDLSAVFFCCRAVIPGMVARGYGRVITIASIAGKEGNPLMPAYSAAKAGVIGLTKSLGKELGASGVMVNAVAPTIIDTPMNRKTSAAAPEMAARLLEKIPIGRRGRVEELAAMVAWLASEECSFTTGFTFDLSGGRATY
jgi:3-oxoacyl-[acyl-carrier protein] reductase